MHMHMFDLVIVIHRFNYSPSSVIPNRFSIHLVWFSGYFLDCLFINSVLHLYSTKRTPFEHESKPQARFLQGLLGEERAVNKKNKRTLFFIMSNHFEM